MTKAKANGFVITAQADIVESAARTSEQKDKALAFILKWVKRDNSVKRRESRAGITLDYLKAKTGYASQASLNNILVKIPARVNKAGDIVLTGNCKSFLGTFAKKENEDAKEPIIYLKVRGPRVKKPKPQSTE